MMTDFLMEIFSIPFECCLPKFREFVYLCRVHIIFVLYRIFNYFFMFFTHIVSNIIALPKSQSSFANDKPKGNLLVGDFTESRTDLQYWH